MTTTPASSAVTSLLKEGEAPRPEPPSAVPTELNAPQESVSPRVASIDRRQA
jgi:hypothetical protein